MEMRLWLWGARQHSYLGRIRISKYVEGRKRREEGGREEGKRRGRERGERGEEEYRQRERGEAKAGGDESRGVR